MNDAEREAIRERLSLSDHNVESLESMLEERPLDSEELEVVSDELEYLRGLQEEHAAGDHEATARGDCASCREVIEGSPENSGLEG